VEEDTGEDMQCTICLHPVSRFVDDEGGLASRKETQKIKKPGFI